MSEAPTIEEFIRHMQAELDTCKEIPDAEERQHKQWQLETAIQQAVIFSNRFKELVRIGKDPLKIVEALSGVIFKKTDFTQRIKIIQNSENEKENYYFGQFKNEIHTAVLFVEYNFQKGIRQ